MVSEPVLWPPPPPPVAGKTILAAVTELGALKHVSTVKDYANKFESLLPFTRLPESTAVRLFIDGLQPDIQHFVRCLGPNSLPSAICFADLQERYGQKPQESNKNDEDTNYLQVQPIDSNRSRIIEDDEGVTEDQQQNDESKAEAIDSDNEEEEVKYGRILNREAKDKKRTEPKSYMNQNDEFEAATVEKLNDCNEDEEKCERIEEEYKTQEITTAQSLKEPESFLKLISPVSVPEVHFAATPFATQTSDLGNNRVSLGLTPLAVVRLQDDERSSEFRTSAQSPMGSQFCYSSSFQWVSSTRSLISPFQRQRSCDIGKWVASSLPRVCFSSPTRTHISLHSSELFTWFNTLLYFDQIAKSHMSIKEGSERVVENKVGLFFVKDGIAKTSHLDIHTVQECNRRTFTIPTSKIRSGHKHSLVTRLQTSQFSNLVSNLQSHVTVLAQNGDFIWHQWRLRTLIDPLFGDATVSSMIRCIIFVFFKGVLSVGFFFLFVNSFTQIIAVSPLHIDKGKSNVQTRKSKGSEEFCFTQTKLFSSELTCLGYCVGNDLQLSSIGNDLQLFSSTYHEAMNFGFVMVILVFSTAAYRCERSNLLIFQGGLPTIFRLVSGGSKQNPTSNGLNIIATVTFYLDMAWAFQAYMGPVIFFEWVWVYSSYIRGFDFGYCLMDIQKGQHFVCSPFFCVSCNLWSKQEKKKSCHAYMFFFFLNDFYNGLHP